jgi:hypothetical protein
MGYEVYEVAINQNPSPHQTLSTTLNSDDRGEGVNKVSRKHFLLPLEVKIYD